MSEKLVENTVPVLAVSDIAESIRFYSEVLGFELVWGGESGSDLCSVARDGCSIMLVRDSDNRKSCVWVGLENDSLFDVVREKGARVLQEPTNNPWAYEMRLLDPDDNVLWLGTGPK